MRGFSGYIDLANEALGYKCKNGEVVSRDQDPLDGFDGGWGGSMGRCRFSRCQERALPITATQLTAGFH
jgi:hypothetical protein